MTGELFITTVTGYDAATGEWRIRLPKANLDTEYGIPAQLLAAVPWTDGTGLKSAPSNVSGTQCLVFKRGNMHYIMGFIQPMGFVVNGNPKPSRKIEAGDAFITHGTQSSIGITKIGTVMLWAQKWANLVINPITQTLNGFFRNIIINTYTSIIEYTYNIATRKGLFRLVTTKDIDASDDPFTVAMPQDRLTVRAGSFDEDEHMLEIFTNQKFDAEQVAHHTVAVKVGRQKDGRWLDIYSKDTDANTSLAIKAGSDGIQIDVNSSKAIVTIAKDGTVTLQATKIKLGSANVSEHIVTWETLKPFLKFHTHLGCFGQPTPLYSSSVTQLETIETTGLDKKILAGNH
jgi:hypothetical protein